MNVALASDRASCLLHSTPYPRVSIYICIIVYMYIYTGCRVEIHRRRNTASMRRRTGLCMYRSKRISCTGCRAGIHLSLHIRLYRVEIHSALHIRLLWYRVEIHSALHIRLPCIFEGCRVEIHPALLCILDVHTREYMIYIYIYMYIYGKIST